MRIEEVLELLEIDSPDQFEHFEHLAELIECTEEISYEAFYAVLNEVEPSTLTELLDCYFDDLMKGIPDDATDFFTLITTIHQALIGLSRGSEYDQKRYFVDELFRFRNWYTFESLARCTAVSDGQAGDVPIVEALALYRMEKLGEMKYKFDFSECMDYPLDGYSMYVSDLTEDDAPEDLEKQETDDE